MNESTGTLFFRSRSMFTPVSEPVQYTDNTTLRHTACKSSLLKLSVVAWLASFKIHERWKLKHGSGQPHARPQAWATGALAPGNVEKCFLLQMVSKTSVDEVFMHHFEQMSSASAGASPKTPTGSCPWTMLGDFRPSDPLIAHPEKKSCGRPWGQPIC